MMRELYQEVILDHNRSPRNRGELENPTGRAEGHNPLCGDQVLVTLIVSNDIVLDVRFSGQGCAISTASASIMTEMVRGKSVSEARVLIAEFVELVTGVREIDEMMEVAALAGVRQFPSRIKCATLAWHTLESALTSGETVATE